MFQKRMEEIDKENKESALFHARPIPKFGDNKAEAKNKAQTYEEPAPVFKALPMPDFERVAFHPEIVHKPPVIPQSPCLMVNKRAEYWKESEREKERVRQIFNEKAAELEREMAMREELELKQYRDSLIFKANPVYYGAPLILKKSEKQLTVPHSPELATSKISCKI